MAVVMGNQPLDFEPGANWDVISDALGRTVEANLPLPTTLRALAADLDDRRTASALKRIAARIERGESLDAIFSKEKSTKSRPVGQLLHAASLTPQPSETLNRFVTIMEDYTSNLRNLRTALSYPFLCLTLALFGAFVISAGWLLPNARDIVAMEEELSLTQPVRLRIELMWAGNLVSLLIGIHVWGIGLLIILGPVRMSRFSLTYQLPMLGRYYAYLNLSLFAKVMAHLTQSGVELSKALEAVAGLVSYPRLRRALKEAAAKAAESATFDEIVRTDQRFPATLRTFVTQSGSKLSLSDRFLAAADFFEDRARALWHAAPVLLMVFAILGLIMLWMTYAIPLMMWIYWIQLLSGLAG